MRPLVATLGSFAMCLVLAMSSAAHAHSGGVSYVDVTRAAGTWHARIDLPLPDVAAELELDADGDGALRWAEVVAAQPQIQASLAHRLRLRHGSSDTCPASASTAPQLVRRASGTHLRIELHYDCTAVAGASKQLDAGPWFAEVPDHGLLVRVGGDSRQVAMLTVDTASLTLTDSANAQWWPTARRFLSLGIEHLITGYDHLAFLALLLLGALRRAGGEPRRVLLDTAGIVTAFTVAHSLTLALAALEVVSLPTRLVEAAIAASILITAVAMALRNSWTPDWRVAFGVGLVHGLGFASLLGDLLDGRTSALPLAAFNVGLEVAQLALVVGALPILLRLARWPAWQPRVAPVLTWLLAASGGLWLWERV
jgi:hypothetical protein